MRTDPAPDGDAIRKLRIDRRLSGSELARRAGISRQHLSDIQRGKRGASLAVIQALADVLACDFEEITQDCPELMADPAP